MKKLLEWQLDAVVKGADLDSFAVLSDPGCGKTLVAINLAATAAPPIDFTTVIIVPNSVVYNWKSELEESGLFPDTNIYIVSGLKKQRLNALALGLNANTICIMPYSIFRSHAFRDAVRMGLNDYQDKYLLICDEAHYIKNPKTVQHKAVDAIAKRAWRRIFLTGTPYLTSIENLFYIYKVLDGGKTFGTQVYGFRHSYMEDANSHMIGSPSYFPKWRPKEGGTEAIAGKILPSSYRVRLQDVVDLPPFVEEYVAVPMTSAQTKLYKQLKSRFIAEYENNIVVAVNAVSKLMKLLQVVSGFFIDEEGKTVQLAENPRMDALEYLIGEIKATGQSCIIWHTFKLDLKEITFRLLEQNIPHSLIEGGQNAYDRQLNIDYFNSGKTKFVIANPQAGGVGINLTAAKYSIVYNRGFGMGKDLQAKARNFRKGSEQHDKVVRYILHTPGTIDDVIKASIAGHVSNAQDILDLFIKNA